MISGKGLGVSILKLLGLENSKTVTPSQAAAFLMREVLQEEWVSPFSSFGGLENSKAVTPSQVGSFLKWGIRQSKKSKKKTKPRNPNGCGICCDICRDMSLYDTPRCNPLSRGSDSGSYLKTSQDSSDKLSSEKAGHACQS